MRALRRLAAVWAFVLGTIFIGIGLENGTLFHANWPLIGVLTLGPLALFLALEWAFSQPPR